ncbi:MAG: hypothetical protein HYX35_04380 [Proteobacteria bacterium]|nr:hypothetical protein [Pseudomonadota bacterium]
MAKKFLRTFLIVQSVALGATLITQPMAADPGKESGPGGKVTFAETSSVNRICEPNDQSQACCCQVPGCKYTYVGACPACEFCPI